MPPGNAVQGGKVHPIASNSGSYLQMAVVRNIGSNSSLTAKAYPADTRFSNDIPYKFEDALQAANTSGFKYCLIMKLGEFRDAAPMTFRDDFVTLNEAHLIDVVSKKDVWTLVEPYRASDTNIGSYYPLLDEIAAKVSKSISKNNIPAGNPGYLKIHDAAGPDIKHGSTAPVASSEKPVDKNIEKLKALKKAHEDELLTEKEYQQKRKVLIDAL